MRVTGASPLTGVCSIASTTAMPSTTRPNTVYLPSSDWRSPVTMKNDVVALAGSSPRAIDRMPLTCFVSLNSGCSGRTSFCCFSVSGPRVVSRPRLHHETADDAVERRPVENACRCEPEEVADVLRRLVGKKLDCDQARRSSRAPRDIGARVAGVSDANGSGSGGGVSRIETVRISMRSFGRPFGVRGRLRNLLDDVHALGDATEDRVLPVECRLIA